MAHGGDVGKATIRVAVKSEGELVDKRGYMAERELSSYQKGVIRNYRENLDTIMLTKLQELVTELYLADSDAKRDRLWLRVQKAMVNLKLPTEAPR